MRPEFFEGIYIAILSDQDEFYIPMEDWRGDAQQYVWGEITDIDMREGMLVRLSHHRKIDHKMWTPCENRVHGLDILVERYHYR